MRAHSSELVLFRRQHLIVGDEPKRCRQASASNKAVPGGVRQRGGEVCPRASPPHPFSCDPPFHTKFFSVRPQLEHSNVRTSKPALAPVKDARDVCRAP